MACFINELQTHRHVCHYVEEKPLRKAVQLVLSNILLYFRVLSWTRCSTLGYFISRPSPHTARIYLIAESIALIVIGRSIVLRLARGSRKRLSTGDAHFVASYIVDHVLVLNESELYLYDQHIWSTLSANRLNNVVCVRYKVQSLSKIYKGLLHHWAFRILLAPLRLVFTMASFAYHLHYSNFYKA